MATLLDTIRGQLAGAPEATPVDETYRAQELLRAKSGKRAVGGSSPRISNLGEQQAAVGNQQALIPLQQQAAISGQNIALQQAQQAQQARQAETATSQARRFQTVENQMRMGQVLDNLEANRANLSLDKDRAKLEQVAFGLAMQDKNYVAQLQDIGMRKRLDNDMQFRGELAGAIFEDNLAILENKLDGAKILDADDRAWKEAMSKLTIADAEKMQNIELEKAAQLSNLSARQMQNEYNQKAMAAAAANRVAGIDALTKGAVQVGGMYKPAAPVISEADTLRTTTRQNTGANYGSSYMGDKDK